MFYSEEHHITESKKSSKNKKIIVLILLNVIIIASVWSFVESERTPTAQVSVTEFTQDSYYLSTGGGIRIDGTVYNIGSASAYNVTLIIEIYVSTFAHPSGLYKTETILLGTIPEGSYAQFGDDIYYPSEVDIFNMTQSVIEAWAEVGGLSWDNQGSTFKIDVFWIGMGSAIGIGFLLLLNIYSAQKLGFFVWLKEHKKPIAITMVWSLAIALVVIKSYWLVYAQNSTLIDNRIAWTQISNWVPRITILDLIIILVISIVAGAILPDIEIVVYSVLANFMLVFALAVLYSTCFIWFILGYGEFFAASGGFLEWGSWVAYVAFKNIFRLTFPLVHIFCFIGAIIGAFVRGYIEPSSGAYVE